MQIVNATFADRSAIQAIYQAAIELQRLKAVTTWPHFSLEMIEYDILQKTLWKIVIDNKIACVFSTTFNDPQIWEEKNNDAAVYLHRIATHIEFRGKKMVQVIVHWVRGYAQKNGKRYIRLDTVGNNKALITHYQKCGFAFVGFKQLHNTKGLPLHYYKATVCLFELEIKN